jgi:hypothetical protein
MLQSLILFLNRLFDLSTPSHLFKKIRKGELRQGVLVICCIIRDIGTLMEKLSEQLNTYGVSLLLFSCSVHGKTSMSSVKEFKRMRI